MRASLYGGGGGATAAATGGGDVVGTAQRLAVVPATQSSHQLTALLDSLPDSVAKKVGNLRNLVF